MEELIKVEVKLERVWKVNKKGGKFLLGVQCKEEKMKESIIKNKKNLGDKEIFIEDDLTWTER